jgi:hypothetical protein
MPRKVIDIYGRRFGLLTVVGFSHIKYRAAHWFCRCDCGVEKAIPSKCLIKGITVSCGCKRAKAKDPVERIMESIEIDDLTGCWNWKLRKDDGGYGRLKIQLGARDKFRMDGAHRYSYEIFRGPVPAGKEVCHSCDNPACVNPNHLWIGTHKQNMEDMVSKGRSTKGRRIDAARAQTHKEGSL